LLAINVCLGYYVKDPTIKLISMVGISISYIYLQWE